ncbi:hypothetical protein FBQ85_01435, partial [Cytophagia bacterium CHB2]|nr:hypothetical protein [Cytophagia bacterium CHB2]
MKSVLVQASVSAARTSIGSSHATAGGSYRRAGPSASPSRPSGRPRAFSSIAPRSGGQVEGDRRCAGALLPVEIGLHLPGPVEGVLHHHRPCDRERSRDAPPGALAVGRLLERPDRDRTGVPLEDRFRRPRRPRVEGERNGDLLVEGSLGKQHAEPQDVLARRRQGEDDPELQVLDRRGGEGGPAALPRGQGIDLHAAAGEPLRLSGGLAGTGVKAGILKCATDEPGVTPGVERVLRAVARAHRETGAPISTHTHAGTRRGLEQQAIFTEEGVDLSRVVIGHSGDTTDVAYLEELIANGSYLGMDRFGIDLVPFEDRAGIVATMCERGHADRMVLSHDASCFIDWLPHDLLPVVMPNWHYLHIHHEVLPALRDRGVTEEQIRAMLVEN